LVIGETIEDGTPVLQGNSEPELNRDELIPAGTLRTPGKPGMVPTAVLTLGQYQKIKPEELAGTRIAHIRYTPWEWLTITDGNKYAKQAAVIDLDGSASFEDDDLTMTDLNMLGLVSEEKIAAFQVEMKTAQEQKVRRDGTAQLKAAVDKLGKEQIIAMLDRWADNSESHDF
jgi:hypothetical protein